MHLSLRTYHLPHLTPELLWRWMLLGIALFVFGLLCYIMVLASAGHGNNMLMAAASSLKHWAS